jgi:hypothetical protein
MRDALTIFITNSVPSQPAIAAPTINTRGALLRVSKKAITIPGRAA